MILSIVTVNLNNRVGLERTMNSVFRQSFNDFEWLVIDGGSTDGSKDLLEEQSNKITYWVSEPDSGIYNAMNKGILKAQGDYLLFLNSGDWLFTDDVLEKVFAISRTADICFGQNMLIKSENCKYLSGRTSTNFSLFSLYEYSIPHQSSFIRKSLFERYGLYDEDYKIVGDLDFFMRVIVLKNCTLEYIGLIVSNFDGNGLSNTALKQVWIERNMIIQKNLPRLVGDDNPQLYSYADVQKAMQLWYRLKNNWIARLVYKLFVKPLKKIR